MARLRNSSGQTAFTPTDGAQVIMTCGYEKMPGVQDCLIRNRRDGMGEVVRSVMVDGRRIYLVRLKNGVSMGAYLASELSPAEATV